jgi:Plasmid pRiA4b ORF-3-like protein
MPGSPPPAGPFVYQLRVVLRGVSPLIWRRLLVRGDSTLADLHATLQLTLEWSDEYLNRFMIHGREYGVAHPMASPSATTRERSAWLISACASANGSSTSTT